MQVVESLLSINHWHRLAKIGAIWADRVAHICQRHLVGHVPRHVLLFPCLRIARSCVQPAKARRAMCSRDGVETSCGEVHLRKASCSMILKLRERQSCCNCEQCAKAEPKISSTSAWDRSTVCSCWQLAQAAEPVLLKSVRCMTLFQYFSKGGMASSTRKGKFRNFFIPYPPGSSLWLKHLGSNSRQKPLSKEVQDNFLKRRSFLRAGARS